MKIFITLALMITLISTSLFAGTLDKGTEYYICHFTNKVSTSFLNELTTNGFNVFKADANQQLLYVTVINHAAFTKEIKSNMSQLVKVDKNGNKTIIVEKAKKSNHQLLNLFFNFI